MVECTWGPTSIFAEPVGPGTALISLGLAHGQEVAALVVSGKSNQHACQIGGVWMERRKKSTKHNFESMSGPRISRIATSCAP